MMIKIITVSLLLLIAFMMGMSWPEFKEIETSLNYLEDQCSK